jgi:hypothetical protein
MGMPHFHPIGQTLDQLPQIRGSIENRSKDRFDIMHALS